MSILFAQADDRSGQNSFVKQNVTLHSVKRRASSVIIGSYAKVSRPHSRMMDTPKSVLTRNIGGDIERRLAVFTADLRGIGRVSNVDFSSAAVGFQHGRAEGRHGKHPFFTVADKGRMVSQFSAVEREALLNNTSESYCFGIGTIVFLVPHTFTPKSPNR